MKHGHRFIGSGGTRGQRGAAIVVNGRWSKSTKRIKAISEKLLAVDVRMWKMFFRYIVTQMPHAKRPDDEVAPVYDEIEKLDEEAAQRHHIIVCGGDWNAVIGAQKEGGDQHTVGDHAYVPE